MASVQVPPDVPLGAFWNTIRAALSNLEHV